MNKAHATAIRFGHICDAPIRLFQDRALGVMTLIAPANKSWVAGRPDGAICVGDDNSAHGVVLRGSGDKRLKSCPVLLRRGHSGVLCNRDGSIAGYEGCNAVAGRCRHRFECLLLAVKNDADASRQGEGRD